MKGFITDRGMNFYIDWNDGEMMDLKHLPEWMREIRGNVEYLIDWPGGNISIEFPLFKRIR